MNEKVDIFKIAQYVLNYAKTQKIYINNTRLNLIMYYTYGLYLSCDKELFEDNFVTYYGPCIEKLYNKYRRFGGNPIFLADYSKTIELPKDLKEVLDSLVDKIGKISSNNYWFLLDKIRESKPFTKAIMNNNVIDKDDIKTYFQSLMEYTKCNACGNQIDAGFKYCPYCGEKIEDKEEKEDVDKKSK